MAHIKYAAGQKTIPTDYAGEGGGGGGSSLPEVTSADEGKVLAVDSDGEWAAENKSGKLESTFELPILTLNKSYNDIVAMLEAGILPYWIDEDSRFYATKKTVFRVCNYGIEDGYYTIYFNGQCTDECSFYAETATENLYFNFD